MPLQPLYFQPGICKNTSVYSAAKTFGSTEGRPATGRYTDGDGIRFIAGFPEKIGGWRTTGTFFGDVTRFLGTPRAIQDWHTNDGTKYMAIGTDAGVLYLYDGTNFSNITPRRTRHIYTLTNAISATIDESILSVADNIQQLHNGDWVFISATAAIGGLTINGWYQINSRTGSGYSFVSPFPATSTEAAGGGTITVWYPRTKLTDPFATTLGSAVVTVTDAGHGSLTPDTVTFVGADPVAGLDLNGTFITTTVDNDHYTITASITASAGTTGGGTVSTVYAQHSLLAFFSADATTLDPFTTTIGSSIITVYDPNHQLFTGNSVCFYNALGTGGLNTAGLFQITVVDADNYTIQLPTPATSSATSGGIPYVFRLQPTIATAQEQPTWSLDTFGAWLLASFNGTSLYVYHPPSSTPLVSVTTNNHAYHVMNSPNSMLAMFVTPERIVVALGTNSIPMQMAWSDQSNLTVWTPAFGNQANSGRTLQGGNRFVGGISVGGGTSMIFSDTTAFLMLYTGDASIYKTPIAAANAGLIGTNAVVTLGGVVYWMSDHDFWEFNGTVNAMPSDDIRDHVFQTIDTTNQWKCVAGTNRAKKEVFFFYPSTTIENDHAVQYHIDQNCWSTQGWGRTAWTDAQVFQQPYATAIDGLLYQHEYGHDANGIELLSFITTSQVDVTNGTQGVNIFGFIPDFERLTGNMSLSINTRYYPENADTVDGPYAFGVNTPPRIDLRSDGREIGFTLSSQVLNGDWRLALCRLELQPSGYRR